MKKLKKSGFTIVELVVVAVLIGILVSLAIPNYTRSVERAKCSQALHILKTMRTAALDYFRENETFVGLNKNKLQAQVNANFVNNSDWAFTLGNRTTSTITITATRLRGPHFQAGNTTITLNESDVWAGTYPKDDPGTF